MNPADRKPRPKILTWLCIGSAISGLFWIVMLLDIMIVSQKGEISAGILPGLAAGCMHAGYLLIFALILLTISGLTGIFKIRKLRQAVFYLCSSAKTIIYFLPVTFIGHNHLTYPGFITSILVLL
jgi:hypothetical protein